MKRRPIQVLVYPARRTHGGWQYLMLHRVPERGAHWQGVSSAPEWDETIAEGARRELREELDLRKRLISVEARGTIPADAPALLLAPR